MAVKYTEQNLIGRKFARIIPDQTSITDITEIKFGEAVLMIESRPTNSFVTVSKYSVVGNNPKPNLSTEWNVWQQPIRGFTSGSDPIPYRGLDHDKSLDLVRDRITFKELIKNLRHGQLPIVRGRLEQI